MESFTLKRMFALAEKFTIPAYQRAYSWVDAQREQLIEDLRDAKEHYYMGHFLFEKNKDDQDEYFIIDGQQRMTTVVIFFSCLIKALSKREDATLKITSLERTYLINTSDNQRFHTVNYDDPLFRRRIVFRQEEKQDNAIESETADSSSARNIIDCRNYFDKVFKETSTEELERWANVLAQSRITYLEVDSKVDAAQIFAFQNDRGKDLTNLEVLKSFFMLQIYLKGDKRQADLINSLEESYRKIYAIIVKLRTNEDYVLRYFWMAYNRGFNTEKPLQEIKDYYKSREIGEVTKFLEDLAEAYKYVHDVESSDETIVVKLCHENNLAWSLPVLIKAKVVAGVSSPIMNCLLHLLENFTFRAMVRGGRASVESRLNKLIEGAKSENTFVENIRQFIDNMSNDYWSDKQLRDALNSGYIFNRHSACSHLLWRYEESLMGKGYEGYERNLFWIADETIEHIAPQTQRGVEIANGYGVYDDKDDANSGIESGEWLSSIGNLMLASKNHNSSLGNKDFADKLADYGKGNLLLQQKEMTAKYENVEVPLWDKVAIESRGKKIIEAAMKIWDLKKVKEMLPEAENALF